MPVILANPLYPQQVGWSGQQAVTTQLNFRQMLDEVVSWNPDLDTMRAGRLVNNYYRKILDKRDWYGLSVRGQLQIGNTVNTGQAVAISGSNIVQGIGTNWTTALIGLQFRIGFTYPYQTINNVNTAQQQLTLDTPFGGGINITGGYNIVEAYVTLGANVKRLKWMRNQQQGWPMEVGMAEETINVWDTWRTQLGWSTCIASLPPTPDGQQQWEVWPTPYQAQVFPFEAWVQPPDMQADNDCPAPFIRSDLIVTRASVDSILMAPKNSPYYKPELAQIFLKEFNTSLEDMENRDNAMDNQDVTWDYGFENGRIGFGPGSTWGQSHDT